MCSSQSEAELASPPPPVRRRRKIIDEDYVFVGEEEENGEGEIEELGDGTKKKKEAEADTEFVPEMEGEDDTEFVPEVVKPKKRGRPRKSESKPVKTGAGVAKAKKSLGTDLLSGGVDKSSSISETGSVGEIINLADCNEDDDDVDDEEDAKSEKTDRNGNYEFPVTVASPDMINSGYKMSQPAQLSLAGTPRQARPGQPRMLRPPKPGRGRSRARPAGQAWPRPGAGARRSLAFPGPRLSNPRSLAPMMRNASHPESQYFPVITPPPPQFLSPSHSAISKLTSLGVSIARERAPPPTRQGWALPPGISMSRTSPLSQAGQGPVMSISTLATSLLQLGQVEGKRRLVQYRLTDDQIRALNILGVGHE